MKIEQFRLERYFAEREFRARYMFSSSDCETMSMSDLVETADEQSTALWNDMRLGYTETAGLPALREEIARLYESARVENVLCGVPEELIFVSMNSLLSEGDHLVCTFPGYQSLYAVAEAIGCEVSRWTPREEDGWAFDVGDLEKMVRGDTRLIVVNFPHNPTGALPSKETFDRIVEIARESGAWLFSDEMYRLLEYDAADRLPAACDTYEKAVSLSGLSKSFGLPGLRCGWIVSRDADFLESAVSFKDYTTICSSAPAEVLSLIALQSRETILAANLARIEKNLLLLDGYFAKQSEQFSWVRPRAGTVAFPRLKAGDSDSFCDSLLRDRGVLLLPSTIFDYGSSHFRIGFGREWGRHSAA